MSVRKQIAFPDGVYFPSPQSLRRDSAPFIGMQLNPILQFFSAFYFCMLFITIVKFALYYGTFLIFPSPQSLRRDSALFIGMQLNPILQFFSAFYFCMLFITIVKFALYYGTFLIFPFLPGNLINKSMFICNSP